MSRRAFTLAERLHLAGNDYVRSVNLRGITYTDDFKKLLILEMEKGKDPKKIFEEAGFDINIIGWPRIKGCSIRWWKLYNERGIEGLIDNRKGNSGRPVGRRNYNNPTRMTSVKKGEVKK